jgi:hypothetical protein
MKRKHNIYGILYGYPVLGCGSSTQSYGTVRNRLFAREVRNLVLTLTVKKTFE